MAARAGGPLSRPRVATPSTRRFSGSFAGLPADALLAGHERSDDPSGQTSGRKFTPGGSVVQRATGFRHRAARESPKLRSDVTSAARAGGQRTGYRSPTRDFVGRHQAPSWSTSRYSRRRPGTPLSSCSPASSSESPAPSRSAGESEDMLLIVGVLWAVLWKTNCSTRRPFTLAGQ